MSEKMVALAHYVRSGFIESTHYGSLALLKDGEITAFGEIDSPIFVRSATKPLQASAMVRLGLDLSAELIALAAASHSGAPLHRKGVLTILQSVGLELSALQCPADRPYGEGERRAFGTELPQRDVHNCSGKHAAMIATAVINGWDTFSYCDPRHPLQQEIKREYEDASQELSTHVGIDGCGAPIFSMSLRGLLKSAHAVATGTTPAREQVYRAMRAFPEMVAGEKRFTTEAMRAIPGLMVKEGAEGVEIAALDDGRAVAFKVIDGSMRAIPEIMLTALSQMGVDIAPLQDLAFTPVLGGGQQVGRILPCSLTSLAPQ